MTEAFEEAVKQIIRDEIHAIFLEEERQSTIRAKEAFQLSVFDDFDINIDTNKHGYLLEVPPKALEKYPRSLFTPGFTPMPWDCIKHHLKLETVGRYKYIRQTTLVFRCELCSEEFRIRRDVFWGE